MKKLLSVILAIGCAISLTACEKKVDKEAETSSPSAVAESGPLNPTPGSVAVGEVNLTAQFIKLDTPLVLTAGVKPCMDMFGDKLYIGDGSSAVREYTFDGTTLTPVKTLAIENRNGISVDSKGQIYADGGVFAAKIYNEDAQVGEAPASGEAVMSKTEDFGLTYFTGDDVVSKISGGAASEWAIKGMNAGGAGQYVGIKKMSIVNGHVLIVGDMDQKQILTVYDTAGNVIGRGTEDLTGNGISALTETANGIMSASVSAIHLSKPDATFIAAQDSTKALFGTTEYCWIYSFLPLSDGTVLTLVSTKRADGNYEALLYKLSGF